MCHACLANKNMACPENRRIFWRTFWKWDFDGQTRLAQIQAEKLFTASVIWEFVLHIFILCIIRSLMQQSWWEGGLEREVSGAVLSVSVGETLSHPPVVFSFRLCELLKEPWSLKSFKAEVSESGRKKNWTRLKEDFVFWWLALPKRVSLGRQQGTGWMGEGELGEFLEGLGRDVNYGFREKEVC